MLTSICVVRHVNLQITYAIDILLKAMFRLILEHAYAPKKLRQVPRLQP